jgi:hypothetical protein
MNIEYYLEELKCFDENDNNITDIKNINKITKIDLSNQNLKEIPTFLPKLINLKVLNLSNNQIQTLFLKNQLFNENTYYGLPNKNLERLNLDGNWLSSLKGLDNLKNLKYLSAESNSIEGICNLNNENLILLNLINNQIEKMENLDYLTELKYLSLNINKISKIEGLNNCTKLKMLELNSNIITKLENIDNCQLEHLDLTNNRLKYSIYSKEHFEKNPFEINFNNNKMENSKLIDKLNKNYRTKVKKVKRYILFRKKRNSDKLKLIEQIKLEKSRYLLNSKNNEIIFGY